MDYIFIGTMRHSKLPTILLCAIRRRFCWTSLTIGLCIFRTTSPLLLWGSYQADSLKKCGS